MNNANSYRFLQTHKCIHCDHFYSIAVDDVVVSLICPLCGSSQKPEVEVPEVQKYNTNTK